MAGRRRAQSHGDAAGWGSFGLLAREVAEHHGIPSGDEVYVVDPRPRCRRTVRRQRADRRVTPLPRYPSVVRDISVLVGDTLSSQRSARPFAGPPHRRWSTCVNLTGIRARVLSTARSSLSFHLTFRSADGTLTDAEVQHEMDSVLAALIERHNALQR